jgi:hypothetical protein
MNLRIFQAVAGLCCLAASMAGCTSRPAVGCTPYYQTGPNSYNRDCYGVPPPPAYGAPYGPPPPVVPAAPAANWFNYGDPRRHQICPWPDTILADGRRQTNCTFVNY